MSDHREIYLQPKCCVNENYGRLWSESPNPDDAEGPEWTAYIIKSEFDQLQAENAKLKAELEELKTRLSAIEKAVDFACAPDMWIETGHGTYEYVYLDWYQDVLQEALQPNGEQQ